MKKILSLVVASMFLLFVAGWTFNVNPTVGNTNKALSYVSKTTQTSLNVPKAKAKKAAPKKVTKKLVGKSTSVTKKTIHKSGNKTITTTTVTTTKHK